MFLELQITMLATSLSTCIEQMDMKDNFTLSVIIFKCSLLKILKEKREKFPIIQRESCFKSWDIRNSIL